MAHLRTLLTRAAAAARTFWRGSTPPPPTAALLGSAGGLARGEAEQTAGGALRGRRRADGGTNHREPMWGFAWTASTTAAVATLAILYKEVSDSHAVEQKRGIELSRENQELKARCAAAEKELQK